MTVTHPEPIKLTTPNLDAILAYQNEDVISRFLDKYNVTEEEALDIFAETKKFLYLGHFGYVFINDDMIIIDEMWHNFILFTHHYQQFCDKFLGGFKHHTPTSKAEKDAAEQRYQEDPQAEKQAFMLKLEDLMSVVYDHLGPETVTKWFEEYPQKYSPDQIKILLK